MGSIYVIRNNVNDKVYVGQTIFPVDVRFARHISMAFSKLSNSYNGHFQRAMRKYGPDAFWIEELEKCDDDNLNEREQYWIRELDSFHNGYNSTLGGDGGRKLESEDILAAWNSGMTIRQIAETLGCRDGHLGDRLRALSVTTEEIRKRGHASISNKVYMYDLDGNFIAEYKSTKQAKKVKGASSLQQALDNCERSAGGYMWRSYKCDHIEPYRDKHNRRTVHQYSIDGEYIATYRSVRAGAHAVGTRRENVRGALTGKSKTSGGYRWSYEKVDRLPPLPKNPHPRPVAKLDDDGNILQIYDTIKQASIDCGKSNTTILNACQGKIKKSAGYRWAYYDGDTDVA